MQFRLSHLSLCHFLQKLVYFSTYSLIIIIIIIITFLFADPTEKWNFRNWSSLETRPP